MKILISDDHLLIREGLKQLLYKIYEFVSIEESDNGRDAWGKIRQNNYDLVILDISMPKMSGLDILLEMKKNRINASVLILSIYPQEHYAIRALKLGAAGYLCKDSAYEELKMAINKISYGGKYISESITSSILRNLIEESGNLPHDKLSERELQVMCFIARGLSLVEIGDKLHLSDKTISTYRSRILIKMEMKNNAELTLYADKHKLIEPN